MRDPSVVARSRVVAQVASEHRDDFERRLLARVRHELDQMDEAYEDGYEIGDYVLTFQFFVAPEPDEELHPWAGGPYPGWWPTAVTIGSSPSYWIDEQMLRDSLRYTRAQLQEVEEDDQDDEELAEGR